MTNPDSNYAVSILMTLRHRVSVSKLIDYFIKANGIRPIDACIKNGQHPVSDTARLKLVLIMSILLLLPVCRYPQRSCL